MQHDACKPKLVLRLGCRLLTDSRVCSQELGEVVLEPLLHDGIPGDVWEMWDAVERKLQSSQTTLPTTSTEQQVQ